MKNADLPAMPTVDWDIKDGIPIVICGDKGLTKREHFAAMAMQGILANPFYSNLLNESILREVEKRQLILNLVIDTADGVIAELEK